MNEDVFYVPEIDMVETDVSIAIVDASRLEVGSQLDETLLEFLIGCKDKITEEVMIESNEYSDAMIGEYNGYISYIVELVEALFPSYVYVETFINDDINVVTPNRSFTFDRVISFKPLHVIVLLRALDE